MAMLSPLPQPATPRQTLLLSVHECAETLRLSRGMVYKLMGRGSLKFVRIGCRRLVPVEAVKAYVAGLMVVGA